ncbi:hypothetical protein ACFRMN_21920 [Streptomyces sp. NPDC056835]|uniref:hypothetical protein n=1 Tax=Streptomyces sp. NPDC056835 TaxID=3345956 RepID=UPI00367CC7BB
MLSEPECGAGCCGAVCATVHRTGGLVIWSHWENTGAGGIVLPEVRFDSDRYDAELARGAADHSWEQPVDTVARLLEQTLQDSGGFQHWNCALTGVWVRRDRLGQVNVHFRFPRQLDEDTPWLAFELLLPVSQDHNAPAEEQAGQLATSVLAVDPRPLAEVRGGSGELALRLGYEWCPSS